MVNTNEITVSSIWVFPIKSCKGTQVSESGYTETGLDFDRQWMIVEEATHRFLTARVIGRMVLIHPTINLKTRTLSITVPAYLTHPESTHSIPLDLDEDAESDTDFHIWGSNHEAFSVGNDALRAALSAFMGKSVLLVQKADMERHGGYDIGTVDECTIKFNDAFPILLCSESSLAEVDSRIIRDVRVDKTRWNKDSKGMEMERFRGNVVIKGAKEPWEEDSYCDITIGKDCKFSVASRCARCMLPNVDPANGIRDKIVPDTILRPYRQVLPMMQEKVNFGVNLIPKTSWGMIRVGDKVDVTQHFARRADGSIERPEDKLGEQVAFSDV